MQARLLCDIPTLPGMLLNWALPCVPYAGLEQGFFALPPIGANVWIEFEQGNPNYPVWTGCFWEVGEIPLAIELSPEDPSLVKVFRSAFCTLMMNDTPETGGITLSVIDPAVDVPVTLVMSSEGLEINVGVVNFTMNPEAGIALNVAETAVTMNEALIEAEAPEISLTAEADVNVTGNTTVEGPMSVIGVVDIDGATSMSPAVSIEGVLNVDGGVEMAPVVNVNGALIVDGETNVAGALTCEGETNVAGLLTAEGDVNVLGGGQVEGNFAVLGLIEGIVVPPFL
jgi:cytoskeletal protein CcmA (bactofilin family)